MRKVIHVHIKIPTKGETNERLGKVINGLVEIGVKFYECDAGGEMKDMLVEFHTQVYAL
jgi:predicted peroxiredoxin